MEALSLTASPFKLRLKDDFSSAVSPFRGDASDNDEAAALFQQLQLLRNENRMRWGEPAGKRVKREVAEEDMLADFKDDDVFEDCEEDVPVGDASSNRMPLKALTNKRTKKHYKKSKKKKKQQQRSNGQSGNKSAAVPLGQSNNENYSVKPLGDSKNNHVKPLASQQQQPNNILPAKRKQNDYCTSKLSIGVTDTSTNKHEPSIGISAPTWEVNNSVPPVDHSLLFNFAFPKEEESEHNLYDDSPTNSSLSWSATSKLDVIEECDEETESDESIAIASTSPKIAQDEDLMDQPQEETDIAESNSLTPALRPLLSSSSLQKEQVSPDFYTDDTTWKDDDQLCQSDSCPFLTAFANLFISKKRKRDCFVLDGCEL